MTNKWSVPTARSELASVCVETGARIDTMVVRMPRIILAEFNTHRVFARPEDPERMLDFSRNAASSRAIPVKRMLEQIMDDPFVPLVWTSEKPGMQGEIITDPEHIKSLETHWLCGRTEAVACAYKMVEHNAHKSLVNRIVEPWMWATVVVTSCEWTNFFAQRVHSAAEPHMQLTAAAMKDAYDSAKPQELHVGDWHLPFTSDLTEEDHNEGSRRWYPERKIIMSVARCASVSYKTVDGFDMTYDRAFDLYKRLEGANPMHASPFEHQASADRRINDERWQFPELHGNLWGWRQYRQFVERRAHETF